MLRWLLAAGLRLSVYAVAAWRMGGAGHFADWLVLTAVIPELLRAVLRRGRRNTRRQDGQVAWIQRGMLADDEHAAAERQLERVGSTA